jgi:conjugal transfer pilus assembly protein TraW
MQENGSLEAESNRIREKILSNVRTPQAVPGIKHTETERTFEYDPTIELTRDLSDHNGRNGGDARLFARKGDRFNPLDVMSLSKPLLFIDGDDEKQVKWAIAKLKDESIPGHSSAKIILVKGSPLELQKKLNRDIYFDQHGVITSKLGIQQVPAIVLQKEGEKVLTIIEEKTAAEK